jgi:hypothetical protein
VLGRNHSRSRQRQRVESLLEDAQRNGPQAVLLVDQLALLGDAQTPAARAVRSAAHQHLRAATATEAAVALAVEERQIYAGAIRSCEQRFLRVPQ